ncbi:hypothetical protein NT6N_21210 [Oceaniferula spumae]|uniref:Ice-binding protein C-terminal domain-containing protein n=1 Tax=Oceaniferula spumae TaxID=2979115 RepID=A0AAT9FMD4_9BACT
MKNLLLPLTLLTALPASAALTLVEDFDALTPGAIDAQNGWTSNHSSYVVAGTGDQHLSSGNNTTVTGASKTATIADGATGTLFLQFKTDNLAARTSFGLGSGGLGDFNNFYAQLAFTGAGDFAVRDGANTNAFNNVTIATGTWYNLWIVANNATDSFEAYIQGGDITTQTKLTTAGADDSFGFRNSSGDITDVRVMAATSANGNEMEFDNIYIDSTAENLVNPVPEPSTSMLTALALGAMVLRRRR